MQGSRHLNSKRGVPTWPPKGSSGTHGSTQQQLDSPDRQLITSSSARYVSPGEAERRAELSKLPPPVVKRALVHATTELTTRNSASNQILTVDMRPLVIHLLAGLEQAGIERAVVTLGHDAAQVAECVVGYNFTRLKIDFVYLTLGSAVGAVWRSLAASVLAARTAFTGSAPLLIVRADNLYDSRLLRKIAMADFTHERRFEAFALVDATPRQVAWATKARPNWARVVLDPTTSGRACRCSPRLGSFDAVVAGEVYATTPKVFELLADLFSQSLSTSLADAMEVFADRGQLGVVAVDELDCHWFVSRTLAGVFHSPACVASGLTDAEDPWGHLCAAARELLYSGEWRPTANMPKPPLRGELEKQTEPLLQLGSTLGEGANGVVVEAEPGARSGTGAGGASRLAVKMFRGQGGREDRHRLEAVMWEVRAVVVPRAAACPDAVYYTGC